MAIKTVDYAAASWKFAPAFSGLLAFSTVGRQNVVLASLTIFAKQKWWAGMDLNHRRTKSDRFTVCCDWPLRNLPMRTITDCLLLIAN